MANWRAAAPQVSFGGEYEDLAPDARRFDVSLAWHAWVGAEQSLALLLDWQAAGALDDVRELARQLGRCGLTARRLGDVELAQLYHASWCPDLARTQRLQRHLADYTALVIQNGQAGRRAS